MCLFSRYYKIIVYNLLNDFAMLKVRVIRSYITRPVRLVFGNGKIKPWLVVSIVVDNSSIFYFSFVQSRVITKSQYMPASF